MAFSSILRAYLKGRIASVLAGLASLCILAAVFSLYALPWEPLGYGFLLTGVFVLSIGIIDFIKFYNKHTVLNRLRNSAILSDYAFPAVNRKYVPIMAKMTATKKSGSAARGDSVVNAM
jgi:hypothetical protein